MIWVRTQNRSQIIECRHIAILEENEFFKIVSVIEKNAFSAEKAYGVTLGVYSSYKNALTVMNEIQIHIDKGNSYTFVMSKDELVSRYTSAHEL